MDQERPGALHSFRKVLPPSTLSLHLPRSLIASPNIFSSSSVWMAGHHCSSGLIVLDLTPRDRLTSSSVLYCLYLGPTAIGPAWITCPSCVSRSLCTNLLFLGAQVSVLQPHLRPIFHSPPPCFPGFLTGLSPESTPQ